MIFPPLISLIEPKRMKKDSNYYTGFKNEYQDGKNLTCRVSLFIISVNAMKGRSNRFPVFRELLDGGKKRSDPMKYIPELSA